MQHFLKTINNPVSTEDAVFVSGYEVWGGVSRCFRRAAIVVKKKKGLWRLEVEKQTK